MQCLSSKSNEMCLFFFIVFFISSNKLRINFITLSIKLIEKIDYISGIVLRDFPLSDIKKVNVTVDFNLMEMIIIDKPACNLSYINGPTIYKSSVLSLINEYIDEINTGQWYYNHGFKLALFNNSGCIFKTYVIDQHVFYHIGYKTSRAGLCNLYLY